MNPISCPVCHTLTDDLEAHTDWHTAVANADPIIIPTTDETAPVLVPVPAEPTVAA